MIKPEEKEVFDRYQFWKTEDKNAKSSSSCQGVLKTDCMQCGCSTGCSCSVGCGGGSGPGCGCSP